MTKTIQAPNYCVVIKMLEEQRLYIQSIYIFKENLNISNNSRGNIVANYQITKLSRQKERTLLNKPISEGFHTREHQIFIRNATRHVVFKRKSSSEGKCFFCGFLFLPDFLNRKFLQVTLNSIYCVRNAPGYMRWKNVFKEVSFLIKEIEKLL